VDKTSHDSAWIFQQADDLLARIRVLTEIIAAVQAEADEAVREISSCYARELAPLREKLKTREKEILALMKSERKSLFAQADVVPLENGSLIYSKELKISIPRDALAKCEELGFTEAIRIAKSLDRGAVAQWPDEKLFLIGAERKAATKFSYEVA